MRQKRNGIHLIEMQFVVIVLKGLSSQTYNLKFQIGSTAIFNHLGDGVVITHHSEHTLRVMDYPSLTIRESPAAHVGGCVALALDPRGR